MARIKNIGDLDWAMGQYSHLGNDFWDDELICPVSFSSDYLAVNYNMLLIFDACVVPTLEHFYEVLSIKEGHGIPVVLGKYPDLIRVAQGFDPKIYTKGLTRAFIEFAKIVGGDLVSWSFVVGTVTVIWIGFTLPTPIGSPDRFLQSMARKMSKWAKE